MIGSNLIECSIRIQNQSGGNPEPALLVEALSAEQFVFIKQGGNMTDVTGDCSPQIPEDDPPLIVHDFLDVTFTCDVTGLNPSVREIKNTIEAEIENRSKTFHSTHSFLP